MKYASCSMRSWRRPPACSWAWYATTSARPSAVEMQAVLDEALLLHSSRNPENLFGHEYEGKLAFQMLDDDGELLFQSASAPPGLLNDMIQQLGLALPNDDQPMRERLAQLARYLIGYHNLTIGEHNWRGVRPA